MQRLDARHLAREIHTSRVIRRQPLQDGDPAGIMKFKKWLALFFIRKGRYKITQAAYMDLAPSDGLMQLDGAPSQLIPRIKALVARKIEGLMREGKEEELFEKGYVTAIRSSWKDEITRMEILREFLRVLSKNTRDIIHADFCNYGLGALIKCYDNSTYIALVAAEVAYSVEESSEHAKDMQFQTKKAYPWELTYTPHSFYGKSENRGMAMRWLAWKLNKFDDKAKDIEADDLEAFSMARILKHVTLFDALSEAKLVTESDRNYIELRGKFGHR